MRGSARAAAIDLALVEDGIEIGKKMMAEMIATYSTGREPRLRRRRPKSGGSGDDTSSAAQRNPTGSGYLNEVRSR